VLSAAEEKALFHLPPGFEIQLVAAEPEIQKPLNLNFDSAGRLWVTSTVMYPWPARTDLQGRAIETFDQNWEENVTAFRGLGMPPEPELAGRDTIRVLSDFGPDGRARKITTFAEGLNIPIGIQPLPRRPGSKGDTVIVFSIPAIWRLEDTDGDGRADMSEKLFDGFGFGDTHGMSASYVLWLDGWIYGTHGFKNRSEIRDPSSGETVVLTSGNTYRFRPDGSAFQHWIVGQTNPFGLTFDPRGDLYSSDSHSKPVYLLQRVGFYEGGGKKHDGLGFAPAITRDDHGSSAIAGIAYYAASHFPEEFRGNLFNGNPVTRRVNRARLDWRGSSPKAVRVADFLSSDDPSFRPVQVKLGPDGALWIADFYNPIIAHYEVPLAHPSRDKTRGRIWRVVWRGIDGTGPVPTMPDLSQEGARGLARRLAETNLTVRTLAANDLVERIGPAAIPVLKELAAQAFPAAGSPAAFPVAAALERLGATDDGALFDVLARAGDETGVAAFRIAAERPELDPGRAGYFAELVASTQAGYRWRQLADLFARHPQSWQAPLLVDMQDRTPPEDEQLHYALSAAMKQQALRATAVQLQAWGRLRPTAEAFIARACLAAGSPETAEFLLAYLERTNFTPERTGDFIQQAARFIAPDRFEVVGALAERVRASGKADQQLALAEGIVAASQRPAITVPTDLRKWTQGVLLESILLADAEMAQRAIAAIEKLELPGKNQALGRVALEIEAAPPVRRAALNAIELDEEGVAILLQLVTRRGDVREDQAQKLAADRLNKLPDNGPLVAAFARTMPTASTNLAVSLAAGLARSETGAAELVRLVELGRAPAAVLRHFWVARELEARSGALRERIATLVRDLPSEDVRLEGVVRKRTAAFPTAQADFSRGGVVFRENCAICHRIRDEGSNLAPSLDGLASRGLMRIIEDILDPNRNVDPAYRLTTITTRAGHTHSGMNYREIGDNVLLNQAVTGEEITVPRGEVIATERHRNSAMPPVFENAIPERQFYDLLAFLLGEEEAARLSAGNSR